MAQENNVAAIISKATGPVIVERNGQDISLKQGDSVYATDTIKTQDSAVEISFADGAKAALSPNTVMTVQEFSYDTNTPSFVLNLAQGAMRTISGEVVEQNPDAFKVSTPKATVGIRGTTFVNKINDDGSEVCFLIALDQGHNLTITTHDGKILSLTLPNQGALIGADGDSALTPYNFTPEEISNLLDQILGSIDELLGVEDQEHIEPAAGEEGDDQGLDSGSNSSQVNIELDQSLLGFLDSDTLSGLLDGLNSNGIDTSIDTGAGGASGPGTDDDLLIDSNDDSGGGTGGTGGTPSVTVYQIDGDTSFSGDVDIINGGTHVLGSQRIEILNDIGDGVVISGDVNTIIDGHVTAGNDTIVGNQMSDGTVVGDAFDMQNGTLFAGNDNISFSQKTGGDSIYGDVKTVAATVTEAHFGDDAINISGDFTDSIISGDVNTIGAGVTSTWGDDTITIGGDVGQNAKIYGDDVSGATDTQGGDDVITVKGTFDGEIYAGGGADTINIDTVGTGANIDLGADDGAADVLRFDNATGNVTIDNFDTDDDKLIINGVEQTITGSGNYGGVTITFDNIDGNVAPVITNAPDLSIAEGAASSSNQVNANDGNPLDTLTYSSAAKTANASDYGTFNIDGAGQYTFTLNNVANGAVDKLGAGDRVDLIYTITVDDGTTSTSQDVTVSITGTNDAPTVTSFQNITGIAEQGVKDNPIIVGNSPNDFFGGVSRGSGTIQGDDVDGDTLSYYIVGAGNSNVITLNGMYGTLSINTATGEYTYTLDNTLAQSLSEGQLVTENFTLRATDGTASVDQPISVEITGTNDQPALTVQNLSIGEDGTSVSDTASATDPDAGVALNFSLTNPSSAITTTQNGQYGSFSIDAAGNYTYTLFTQAQNASAYNTVQSLEINQTLTETFDIYVQDGEGAYTTQEVTVTINGASEGALSTTIAVNSDDANVAANTDADNTNDVVVTINLDPADIAAGMSFDTNANLPNSQYGTFSFDGGNLVFTQTKAFDHSAGNSFTVDVAIKDAVGATGTATVTITITDSVPTISATVASNSVVEGNSTTGTITADFGADVPVDATVKVGTMAGGVFTAATTEHATLGWDVGNGYVKLSADGQSYTFTAKPDKAGENETFTFQITDSDDDTITTDVTVSMTDAVTTATITVNSVTADNTINAAESAVGVEVAVTGTVGGDAAVGDTVTLTVNGNNYTGLVQADGSYSINVLGSDLAVDATFDAKVEGTDAKGNSFTANTTHTVTVDTTASATITVNNVTADNTINASESIANVTVTGTVGGDATVGDTVTLTVNGNEYTGQVQAGLTYSINVLGSDLVADNTIDAKIEGTDAAGNPFTGNATHTVLVDTNTTATITLDTIAGDGVLNSVEAAGDVAITGRVDGDVKAGDTVTLTVGAQDFTGTLAADLTFSIDVPGNVLAANNSITTFVTASDAAGNSKPITHTEGYTVDTAPTIITAGTVSLDEGELTEGTHVTKDAVFEQSFTIIEDNLASVTIAGQNIVLDAAGSGSYNGAAITPAGAPYSISNVVITNNGDGTYTVNCNVTLNDNITTHDVQGADDVKPTVGFDISTADKVGNLSSTTVDVNIIDDGVAFSAEAPITLTEGTSTAAGLTFADNFTGADKEGGTYDVTTVSTVGTSTDYIAKISTFDYDWGIVTLNYETGVYSVDIKPDYTGSGTETFNVEFTDSDGDKANIDVTVNITQATNVAPVITAVNALIVQEAGVGDGDDTQESATPNAPFAGISGVPGGITAHDPDNSGSITFSVENGAAHADAAYAAYDFKVTGLYGDLYLDADSGQYIYVVDETRANTLTEGDAPTERFTVTANDGEADSDPMDIVVTVKGTNDAPVLTLDATNGHGATVGGGPGDLTIDEDGINGAGGAGGPVYGQIVVNDPDTGDSMTFFVSETGKNFGETLGDADDFTNGLTLDTTLLELNYGSVQVGANGDLIGGYNYYVDDTKTQHLSEGDSVTDTFTVYAQDKNGAWTSKDVTVTITGTNDAPQLTLTPDVGTDNEVTGGGDDDANKDTATGIVDVIDVDADGTTQILSITYGGTTNTAANAGGDVTLVGTYGTLVINGATGAYTYTLGLTDTQRNAIDTLRDNAGQTTETFTITTTDAHGAANGKDLVITVNAGEEGGGDVSALQMPSTAYNIADELSYGNVQNSGILVGDSNPATVAGTGNVAGADTITLSGNVQGSGIIVGDIHEDTSGNTPIAGGNDSISVTGSLQDTGIIFGDSSATGYENVTAGNDTITITGNMQGSGAGSFIYGDNAPGGAQLYESTSVGGNDSITVSSNMQDNATIHGGAGNDTISIGDTMSGSATIYGGRGDDVFNINNLGNQATINGGHGDDVFNLTNVTAGTGVDAANIDLGFGDNIINIVNSLTQGEININRAGADDSTATDTLYLQNGATGGSINFEGVSNVTIQGGSAANPGAANVEGVNLNTSSGNDYFNLGTVKNTSIEAGGGNDTVSIGTLQEGNDIYTRDGDDSVVISDVTQTATIDLGTGENSLTISNAVDLGSNSLTIISENSGYTGDKIVFENGISSGTINLNGNIDANAGDNFMEGGYIGFDMSGGTIILSQGAGVTIGTMSGNAKIQSTEALAYNLEIESMQDNAIIEGSGSNDRITITSVTGGTINAGVGDDTIIIEEQGQQSIPSIFAGGTINGGDGADSIVIEAMSGGTIDGGGDAGQDTVTITELSGTNNIFSNLAELNITTLQDGASYTITNVGKITIAGKEITGNTDGTGSADNDLINLDNLDEDINTLAGDDIVIVRGTLNGDIVAGEGNDSISVNAHDIGIIDGGIGTDTFTLTGTIDWWDSFEISNIQNVEVINIANLGQNGVVNGVGSDEFTIINMEDGSVYGQDQYNNGANPRAGIVNVTNLSGTDNHFEDIITLNLNNVDTYTTFTIENVGSVKLQGIEYAVQYADSLVDTSLTGTTGADYLMVKGDITNNASSIWGDDGADMITLAGTMQVGLVAGGVGADTINIHTLQDGSVYAGEFMSNADTSSNKIVIENMNGGSVYGGADSDTFDIGTLNAGTLDGFTGDDTININKMLGGTVTSNGYTEISIENGAEITGTIINAGDANNYIYLADGMQSGTLILQANGNQGFSVNFTDSNFNNNTSMSGGTINGSAKDDSFSISNVSGASTINAGDGNDNISIYTMQAGAINGDAGNDGIDIDIYTGGIIDGGAGDDTLNIRMVDQTLNLDDIRNVENITIGENSYYPVGVEGGTINGTADADNITIEYMNNGTFDGKGGGDTVNVDTLSGTNTFKNIEKLVIDKVENGSYTVENVGEVWVGGTLITGAVLAEENFSDGSTLNGTDAGDFISISKQMTDGTIAAGGGDDNIAVNTMSGGTINAGAGGDNISLTTIVAHAGIAGTIDGGEGDDTLVLTKTIGENGTGLPEDNDLVDLTQLNINNVESVVINTIRYGTLKNSAQVQKLIINDFNGFNSSSGTFKGILEGHTGDDDIEIRNIGGDANITLGTGNDKLSIDSISAYGPDVIIDGGEGSDTVIINDTLESPDGSEFIFSNIEDLRLSKIDTDAEYTMTNIGKLTIGNAEITGLQHYNDGRYTSNITVSGTSDANDLIHFVDNFASLSSGNLDTQGGDDVILIAADVGGSISTINAGAGNDSIHISTLENDALISGGSGSDTIHIDHINDRGRVDGGSGNDEIYINNITAAGSITGGTGNDAITVNRFSEGTITGGEGNDTFTTGLSGTINNSTYRPTIDLTETTQTEDIVQLYYHPRDDADQYVTVKNFNVGTDKLYVDKDPITDANNFGSYSTGEAIDISAADIAAGEKIIGLADGHTITVYFTQSTLKNRQNY